MGYFDSEKNVEEYIEMAEGYDGAELIAILREHLPEGSSILELGMGPGKDQEDLTRSYNVTGSDNSRIFIDRYLREHPEADLMVLDAVSMKTERTYDCIYSNKVLHQLDREQLKESFHLQKKVLKPGGLLLHSFWYGKEFEEIHDFISYNITEEELISIVEKDYKVLRLELYAEMEEDDSLFILLEKL